MGGEDFSEYSLPDHSIPAVDVHVGAVGPRENRRLAKRMVRVAEFASSKFAPVPSPPFARALLR